MVNRAALTPTINITPLLVNSQQGRGTLVTRTLTISNTGMGNLAWRILPAPATHYNTDQPTAAALNVVQDGSFESGNPNFYWATYSAKRGTPLCGLYSCFFAGAHTGNWWALFGGAGNNQAESGYVSQTITITPGLAHLDFWMKIQSASGTGNFTVTLDNSIIFTADQTMTPTYGAGYALVSRNVAVFADGHAHILKFAESDPATPGTFSLFVDDVSLYSFTVYLPLLRR
jgi:hypothetical protein